MVAAVADAVRATLQSGAEYDLAEPGQIRSVSLAIFDRTARSGAVTGLALNLGSRSQNLAAKLMGIPVVEIMDYEHTAESSLLESRWYLTPKVVCAAIHGARLFPLVCSAIH